MCGSVDEVAIWARSLLNVYSIVLPVLINVNVPKAYPVFCTVPKSKVIVVPSSITSVTLVTSNVWIEKSESNPSTWSPTAWNLTVYTPSGNDSKNVV